MTSLDIRPEHSYSPISMRSAQHKGTQIHQHDNDDMNPLPPILPAEETVVPAEEPVLSTPVTLKEVHLSMHLQVLFGYLQHHDKKMLARVMRVYQRHSFPYLGSRFGKKETMREVRKTMGEAHWIVFLDYYKHCMLHLETCESGQLLAWFDTNPRLMDSPVAVPLPPPFPRLSTMLDDNVTAAIFGFLDGKSVYEASKVSRAFRDALIPRQKNVTMSGFSSFQSFRRMNFIGMEFLDVGDSFITDNDLEVIANDREAYPNLSRASLSRCKHVTRCGEDDFVDIMGPRLEKLECIWTQWTFQ